MKYISVNLTGITFNNSQDCVQKCKELGTCFCTVEREPDNEHDPNAVAVRIGGQFTLGYLFKPIAIIAAKQIDSGKQLEAEIEQLEQLESGTIWLIVRISPWENVR